jgi:hypothetical protein
MQQKNLFGLPVCSPSIAFNGNISKDTRQRATWKQRTTPYVGGLFPSCVRPASGVIGIGWRVHVSDILGVRSTTANDSLIACGPLMLHPTHGTVGPHRKSWESLKVMY